MRGMRSALPQLCPDAASNRKQNVSARRLQCIVVMHSQSKLAVHLPFFECLI